MYASLQIGYDWEYNRNKFAKHAGNMSTRREAEPSILISHYSKSYAEATRYMKSIMSLSTKP